MKSLLRDQRALVTGAGRGIGRGCAEALAEAGAKVIAVARTLADLEQLAAHNSGNIETWQYDVADAQFLQRVSETEGLSILVNNAGANRPEAFTDVDETSLDAVLNLNVRSTFLVAQAAVRAMRKQGTSGSIVNMSSQMGHVGSPNRTVYCMTKHAVEGLTKAMAVELGEYGIRVNTVAPTFVETALTRPMLEQPEFRDFVMRQLPLNRLASVDDVVAAVMYLVSPAAGSVTGHSLRVDGGWTAH